MINKNAKVYLIYSIKKPVAFVFDIDYLYKAIDFDVEAYSFIKEYKMSDKNNNLLFKPILINEYADSSLLGFGKTRLFMSGSILKNNINL